MARPYRVRLRCARNAAHTWPCATTDARTPAAAVLANTWPSTVHCVRTLVPAERLPRLPAPDVPPPTPTTTPTPTPTPTPPAMTPTAAARRGVVRADATAAAARVSSSTRVSSAGPTSRPTPQHQPPRYRFCFRRDPGKCAECGVPDPPTFRYHAGINYNPNSKNVKQPLRANPYASTPTAALLR